MALKENLKRNTGSGQSFKQDKPITIVNYLKEVREMAKEFSEDEILNLDESSFYTDWTLLETILCLTNGPEKPMQPQMV